MNRDSVSKLQRRKRRNRESYRRASRVLYGGMEISMTEVTVSETKAQRLFYSYYEVSSHQWPRVGGHTRVSGHFSCSALLVGEGVKKNWPKPKRENNSVTFTCIQSTYFHAFSLGNFLIPF